MDEAGKKNLLNVLNNIVLTKNVPKDWNIGIILPIYEKGDAKDGQIT